MNTKVSGSFSDLISHLRSINQSIVFVSIALLMTALLAEKPDNISIAIDQLGTLKKITYWENWNTQFIYAEFHSKSGVDFDFDELHPQYDIEFPIPEQYRDGTLAGETHTIGISAPLFTFVGWDYTGYLVSETEVYVEAPKTLAEFNQLWDKSRNVQAIYTGDLLDHAYVQLSPELPIEKISVRLMREDESYVSNYGIFTLGAFTPNIFAPQNVDENDRDLYGLSTTIDQGYGDLAIWKFWIPARSKPSIDAFTFDASSYLCFKMKMNKEDCNGSFEQVFPELYLTVQEFRNLTFDDAIKMLEIKRESQLQSFNLLGFDLPASETRWIGSLTIILMQFYFYLLIRAFNTTKIQNDFPAWVGIFDDGFSQKISASSVTLLPVLSIFVLNYRWLFLNWQEVMLAITFIGSSWVLSYFILLSFNSIWKIIEYSNSGTTKRTSIYAKKTNKISNLAKRKKY